MAAKTSTKTLHAKQSYKQFSIKQGVSIKHYHCNNSKFADSAFKKHAEWQQQKLIFCGVHAHFRKEIAERAIWDLTKSTMMHVLEGKTSREKFREFKWDSICGLITPLVAWNMH
ncbi:hypothetical protein ACHAW6_009078 [Cyclotella cf. meneghiniana]